MFAVNMSLAKTTFTCGALSLFLLACGGAQSRTGYAKGEKEPWSSPIKLKLTDNGEASTEGNVNYPKSQRAKWYVLDLPAPGYVRAKITMDALSTGADVGFEILDSGFNVVAKPTDDNDIGQDEKVRIVKEARSGRTYFHVYTLGKTDVADYRLRVRYEPKLTSQPQVAAQETADPKSSFPWTVPNLPPIPAVPANDDAPRKGRKPPPEAPDEPAPVAEPDPAEGAKVRGKVIEFAKQGSGVHLVVNKGSEAGVEVGWTGYVVDKSGKSMKKGAFKIKKTRSDESEGVVGLTLDEIQGNREVVLKPPQ